MPSWAVILEMCFCKSLFESIGMKHFDRNENFLRIS